jgi:hypothetical protein
MRGRGEKEMPQIANTEEMRTKKARSWFMRKRSKER